MSDVKIDEVRKAEYPIDEMFLNRWSPRAFQEKEVDEDTLMTVLEAAKWAPSGANKQPWRFILANTEEDLETFHSFIMEGNLVWAKKAPAYVLIISDSNESVSHAFDAGTAWGYLALQAMKSGLITHAMGGIHKDQARELLDIPDHFDIHALIAIGYQDDVSVLEERYQEREIPSERKPLTETVMKGKFVRA